MEKFKVGEFYVDFRDNTLIQDDEERKIEPQLASLLKLFIDHPNHIISRDTIVAHLWPDRIVSDDALRAAIKKLREALQDNAKSPLYIKTYPMKGYQLIADVSIWQPKIGSSISTKVLLVGFAVTAIIASSIAMYFKFDSETTLSVTQLTNMSGSELNPDYDANHERLVFSHREQKNEFLHLHVKDMNSDKTIRLTWDQANHASAFWSPDGKLLAYSKSTPQDLTHYIAKFDLTNGLSDILTLPSTILDDKYVLGWAHNQKALYVTNKPSQNKPQSLWKYDLVNQALTQITSPSVVGQGDYAINESPNGELLAILRSVTANKHELLIMHLATGELLHTLSLPHVFQTAEWRGVEHLVMSSFSGKVFSYDLAKRQLEEVVLDAPYINHVFHLCGNHCYYMRQHNGNYLDLQEQPNPLLKSWTQSLNYFELPDANGLPIYSDKRNGVFFVTQAHTATTISFLPASGSAADIVSVITLPAGTVISSMSINNLEDKIAATIDNRVAIVDIVHGSVDFISSDIDIVFAPIWHESSEHLFFAKLESNSPVLYQYTAETKQYVRVMEGFISQRTLTNGESLRVDENYNVWLKNKTSKEATFVVQLPSVSPNRWVVVEDSVYYTSRKENIAYLNKVNLRTSQQQSIELAKNRFKLDFDLSANAATLIGVKSVLAQSNLVRVELLN